MKTQGAGIESLESGKEDGKTIAHEDVMFLRATMWLLVVIFGALTVITAIFGGTVTLKIPMMAINPFYNATTKTFGEDEPSIQSYRAAGRVCITYFIGFLETLFYLVVLHMWDMGGAQKVLNLGIFSINIPVDNYRNNYFHRVNYFRDWFGAALIAYTHSLILERLSESQTETALHTVVVFCAFGIIFVVGDFLNDGSKIDGKVSNWWKFGIPFFGLAIVFTSLFIAYRDINRFTNIPAYEETSAIFLIVFEACFVALMYLVWTPTIRHTFTFRSAEVIFHALLLLMSSVIGCTLVFGDYSLR